ncbi:SH2 domain-containing protein 1A-like isoform X1 [Dunckerocampus dactyliophorus]|uniref:SH2 domain-containing protein 1A-like isoform X1 n=1 Tax=Dunckerocampus dactyliophorus TaxID=161453 RepID=UPI0024058414|nr:SH2 domain-containing protein 1A-like isoform X1 [Dunckerocampus dactyliophorus]
MKTSGKSDMENLSVYHGPIGKTEGERRLALDGRNGCYLIRNSDSVPDVYCLCVLCNGTVYTYRLHKHGGCSWAAERQSRVYLASHPKSSGIVSSSPVTLNMITSTDVGPHEMLRSRIIS